jgi:putative ABC transport system ATP-binding protein
VQPLIELHNVCKKYKMDSVEFTALCDINLKIKNGERVAIMGPSGCGKSTMLHLIGCLDRPTRGKIMIGGKDISKLSDDELAKIRGKTVGFVFQFFYLIPTLSALRNVMMPMDFIGINKSESEKRAKELLNLVGLTDKIDNLPSQMSGGQRQRVAIARAMANNPEIILADEPTGNLDSKSGKEIVEILLKLNKEKKVTLIVITHDPLIATHAERIIYLKDGRIIKEGSK